MAMSALAALLAHGASGDDQLFDGYEEAGPDDPVVAPGVRLPRAFELAHDAIYKAIKRTEGTFEKDGMLVMEVDEEDWELGYDAVDGGTTASVAAVIDGLEWLDVDLVRSLVHGGGIRMRTLTFRHCSSFACGVATATSGARP